MSILKNDIQTAPGCLQTCTGLRSGIEAAIHATHKSWDHPSTQCLLQVDVDNAFNRLNRNVALHNIKEICPSLVTYLHNHYQSAANLFVKDDCKQEVFLSDEGCTQGDPSAMSFYALGVKPLVDILADSIDDEKCQQSWFADDSNSIGELAEVIKIWWQTLNTYRPKFHSQIHVSS